MMTKTALDATDQKLLSLLRENARTSTAELARGLGLSRTTVQSRIERLERGGVAAGSIGELDAVIDRIGQMDGVERTMSAIVLSTRFER